MSEEYPDWQDEKVKVVRNHEMVVSIWPADRENALGWFDVGMAGSKEECLAWVEKHCDGNCRLVSSPEPSQAACCDLPNEVSPTRCHPATSAAPDCGLTEEPRSSKLSTSSFGSPASATGTPGLSGPV